LNALQGDTQSYLAGARVSGEGESPIKIEIPETGLSLGEVSRALREWLGHETHVTGEVYRTTGADGAPALALTIRAGEEPGERILAPEGGVDALLQSGAEKVYAGISPFRFVDWLKQNNRTPEARELLTRLSVHGTVPQKASAEAGLAAREVGLPDDERWTHLQEAARLRPQASDVQTSLGSFEERRGHAEAAFRFRQAALTAPLPPGLSNSGRKIRDSQRRFNLETASGDWSSALLEGATGAELQDSDPGEWSRQVAMAQADINLHDLDAARRFVQTGYVHIRTPSPGLSVSLEAGLSYAKVLLALAESDWNRALAEAAHLRAVDTSRIFLPWLTDIHEAHALARLGRLAEAEALIATTPTDCYPCVRIRAQIAEIKGDHAAADRWFAEALRQGPSLPFAESEWGDALAARGEFDLAASKYEAAHAKSPRFADALKGWGDVLARQGQWSAGLAKYDEALKLAPNWRELHQARDATGKHAI
jgi:tetratricopeptide (TPR) repeat protein